MGARFRVQHDLETKSSEVGYGLYSDLTFSRLTLSLEYEAGMRTDDDLGLIMERDEQRWQVELKKTF